MKASERRELVSKAEFGEKPGATADEAMAITSHPLATRVAVEIMEEGGNACDFDMDIKESVHRPRFGGAQSEDAGTIWEGPNAIEGTLDDDLIDELRSRGVDMQVVNQWNWHCGSFEGIHITEDGTLHACGDPRRASRAEGF